LAEQAEGHGDWDGFFDVDVEALDVVFAQDGEEGVVVGAELGVVRLAFIVVVVDSIRFTYRFIVAAESLEGSSGGASEHHHYFHPAFLELFGFGPEGVVHWVAGRMVV
jgi:hypothetical protein